MLSRLRGQGGCDSKVGKLTWAALAFSIVVLAGPPPRTPIGGGLGPSAALAACNNSNHCYGVNKFFYQGHGGSVYVVVNPFTNSNNCVSYMNAAMWVGTELDFTYFVEQGMMNGRYTEQGCPGLHWYWVDKKPIYGLNYHPSTLQTRLNVTYQLKISWTNTDGNWGLYRDGTWWMSSSLGCCGQVLEAGFEDGTLGNVAVDGSAGTFQKKTLSDTWNYNWPGTIITDAPVTAGWNTPGASMWFHE
jgi:hypothetical protein